MQIMPVLCSLDINSFTHTTYKCLGVFRVFNYLILFGGPAVQVCSALLLAFVMEKDVCFLIESEGMFSFPQNVILSSVKEMTSVGSACITVL